jgi:branched-chain amino acid transport system permease protein
VSVRGILLVIAAAVAVALIAMGAGRFGAFIIYTVAIASIAAIALNLLVGYCGQISFAQAGLIGVGAYTAGILGNAGADMSVALVGAGVVTAVAGVLIGLPALRLRGLYFGIATLAAQVILEYLFRLLEPITHGVSGLMIEPAPFLGLPMRTDQAYAGLSVGLLALCVIATSRLLRTNLGRCFLVIRDSELVARGMGINVARVKLRAFLISGFITGLAGGLIAFTNRIAAPEAFDLSLSVDYVAMIIVGGLGSIGGSILGAGFVVLLPEAVQRLGEHLGVATQVAAMRELLFGLLIILFLIFEPRGLYALLSRLAPRRRQPDTHRGPPVGLPTGDVAAPAHETSENERLSKAV